MKTKDGVIPVQDRILAINNTLQFYREEAKKWPNTILVLPHVVVGMCQRLGIELEALGYNGIYMMLLAEDGYSLHFTRENFNRLFKDKVNPIPGNEFYWTGKTKRDYIMRYLFLRWIKSKLIEEYENSKKD